MPNTRTKVGYIGDDNNHYAISVPTKYVTPGGFAAPVGGELTLPRGYRLRKANIRTHVADSVTGANDAHFLERKVPCNPSALAAGGALAKNASITLDGVVWLAQGHTGERLKNIQ